MKASSSPALAIGIAIGGGCIGLGIFFGLRARGPAPEGTAAASSVEPRAGASSGATTVAVDAARAEVAGQLEAARLALRDKCWTPAAAVKPAPDHSTYAVDATFDASGKRLALVVNPASRADRAEIAFCLTGAMPALAITPRGATVHVVSRLTLP